MLADEIRLCTACKLRDECRQPIPGEGPLDAKIIFIGRNPGRTEDATGKPFQGQAGNLLIRMIRALGLEREQCYITNVVKCYTKGNRIPEAQSIHTCSEKWLWRELAEHTTVSKPLIVTLGSEALHLFQPYGSIMQLTGTTHSFMNLIIFHSLHPAAPLHDQLKYQLFMETIEKLKVLYRAQGKEKSND